MSIESERAGKLLRDALYQLQLGGKDIVREWIIEAVMLIDPPTKSREERIAVELDDLSINITNPDAQMSVQAGLRNIAAILREPKAAA